MAFRITNAVLKEYIESHNMNADDGNVRVFGVRGAIPYGADQLSLQPNKLDLWNDTIGIWGGHWALFKGTVDPGLGPTQHPEVAQGAAHLLGLEEGGQPWHFKWGLHHGAYECLVQAENFKLRRDSDHDGVGEPAEPLAVGDFGIHIHWGGDQQLVGNWSAGCQVLWGRDGAGSPWQTFKAALKATGQTKFAYYLIDGAKLAAHVGA